MVNPLLMLTYSSDGANTHTQHSTVQSVGMLNMRSAALLSIKSKIIIPISECRIRFIFVSMSCNTFSRKNTIKNNMLMSRTNTTLHCKQCDLNAQICLLLLGSYLYRRRQRRWWRCAVVLFWCWCWLYCCHSLWHPVCCCYSKFAYATMRVCIRMKLWKLVLN